ncbi:lipopolysaccharide modification acyltransferase [Humibacillus sp. DSM 29435]|uniref:acyltransferase family protein n=1 Tax=Humibacillus sp. DSM 29435 TaxID=1869167 RepID=UPI0008724296|nr:acyltransferase family protein [Humibacillus sp. DSM 29435]OFE16865.1 lipopolysaccharide modification acyltransferase [Humibacillus sp. DSM 29435]
MTTSATSRINDTRQPGAPLGEGSSRRISRGMAHIAGLDGLRALAIVAVLVFHLNASWLPGGFLGVDVFFVVSGFLITSLLVHEKRRTGRIAFSQFWLRRARRLVPALVLCVVTSVLIARLVSGDLLVSIGRQILGALTFSTNWVEITAGSSYFDQTAPQLFMNFWSLAVEEQFYLVWPFVTLGLLAVASSRLRVASALAIGAGSSVLMALLFDPAGDSTRVYYGTDTHLMGLMIGAAIAFAWASPTMSLRIAPSQWGLAGRAAVPLAAVVLLALMFRLDESNPFTFRGGILLACLATGVLVLGLLDRPPGRPTAWRSFASSPVAVWIGQRSYSLYLWHWPVILIIAIDHPAAPGTIDHLLTRLWCVVVTLALADLTYRFVETPFRRDGFTAVGSRVLVTVGRCSRRVRQVVAATVAVTAMLTIVVLVTAPDQSQTALLLEQNEAGAAAGSLGSPAPGSGTALGTVSPLLPAVSPASPWALRSGSSSSPASGASAAPSAPTAPAPGKNVDAADAKASFTMPAGTDIDAYGDSIMVGSLGALRYYFDGIRIDAKSNRRWSDGLAQVKARADGNRRAVVLAFGTNWGVDADQTRATLDALGPDRMVVLVNIMGPMARVDKDNDTLAAIAAERPNVEVADWAAAVRAHPDQLQSDRIHPSLTGAHLFAKTVRQAFADLSEQHTGQKVTLKNLPIP